jgi:hypothetical protein
MTRAPALNNLAHFRGCDTKLDTGRFSTGLLPVAPSCKEWMFVQVRHMYASGGESVEIEFGR